MISPSAHGSIHEIGDQIRARTLSPVTVVAACLQRIDQVNPKLNAFATVLADESVEEARHAEAEISAGRWLGVLHGIPIGIKDFYDTAGVRTTAAARQFLNRIPSSDAELVSRLSFRDVDVLVLPTTNGSIPTVKQAEGNPLALAAENTMFANYFGLPAISVPSGLDARGCHSLYRSSAGRGRTARCWSWLTHS